MNASTDSSGEKRRGCGCGLWALLLLVGLPLAILLIVTSAFAIRGSIAGGKLQKQIAEWEAKGIPYDNASLEEFYQRNTTEENIEAWKAAIAVFQSPAFRESTNNIGPWSTTDLGRVPTADQDWPAEAETRSFLERWKSLCSSIQELAKHDRAIRFPIQFDSMNTLLETTQEMRSIGRLLSLETQVAIRDRDSSATREGIVSLYGIARTIEGQPFLIAQLVTNALENMATLELRSALKEDLLTVEDLQLVRDRIRKRTPWGQSWRYSIQGERGGMLPVFTEPNRYSPTSIGVPLTLVPFRSRDTLAYVEWMNKAEAISTEDLTTFHREISAWGQELKNTTNASWFSRLEMMLTSLSIPAIESVGQAFIRREMLYRLAELSIEVRLYEKQHGRLPQSLKELEANGTNLQLLQPMGDKPFGFLVKEDRIILWGFESRAGAMPDQPPEVEQDPTAELWRWELPGKH